MFFRPLHKILGNDYRNLVKPNSSLLSGPVLHELSKPAVRGLHYQFLNSPKNENKLFVAIGGGIGALAHIQNFFKAYYEANRHHPDIVMITDEKSHWLNQINPDWHGRLWGQPVDALIKPLQEIAIKKLHLAGNQYPNLAQMIKIRNIFIEEAGKKGVRIIDDRVTRITSKGKDLMLQLQQNHESFRVGSQDSLLINFATMPRKTEQRLLASASQDGGLFYSSKKSNEPVCVVGGGLTAYWAVLDNPGPVVIVREKSFPLNFREKLPEMLSKKVTELVIDETHFSKYSNEITLEGTDAHTGKAVRMSVGSDRFFTASGSVFNHSLTSQINESNVIDVNPYSSSGKKAGEHAIGTINPEGSLLHRYAVFSFLLGKYPIEEGANVLRYLNLWHDYVEQKAVEKFIKIDRKFYIEVEPLIKELFLASVVPKQEQLEDLLSRVYKRVLGDDDHRSSWDKVKDIIVPITDQFDHIIHGDYSDHAFKPSQRF